MVPLFLTQRTKAAPENPAAAAAWPETSAATTPKLVSLPALPGFPEFVPHPFVRGGHAQTIAGFLFPAAAPLPDTVRHRVPMEDGDTIVVHDNVPAGWRPGCPAAVLVHGLTGSAESSYMRRTAAKLVSRGVRTFRMDQRTCGAGMGLARRGYHAGRSADVRELVHFVSRLASESPMTAVGFSLGGNLVLKMLGEDPTGIPPQLVRAIAVNPSADLAACARSFETRMGRIYDRHFVQALHAHFVQCPEIHERGRVISGERPIRRLIEFDDFYTAPVNGFTDAAHYYRECSAGQFVPKILVPTWIVSAADDPVVPADAILAIERPPNVLLHVARSGGHLGFIGRGGVDPDRRWMDWRVVDWATAG